MDTSAVGLNGITISIFKRIWPVIGEEITILYNECIIKRDHSFGTYELIFIFKKSRDLTIVKEWRPIALLSILSKGLKRVVALRLNRDGLAKG